MSKFVRFAVSSVYRNYSVCSFSIYERNPKLILKPIMAQKSIMSFFSKAPAKLIVPDKQKVSEEKQLTPKKEVKLEDDDSCSPLKIKGRGSKRLRIDSSDGDSNPPPEKRASTDIRETEPSDSEVKKESQDSSKENIEETISEDEVEKSPVANKTKENKKQVKSAEKKTPKNSKKEAKSAQKKTPKSSNKTQTPKSSKKEQSPKTESAEKVSEKDFHKKNAISLKEEKITSSSDSEEDVRVSKKKKSKAKKPAISSSDEEDAEKMDCSEESDRDNSIEEKQLPKDKKNIKKSPKDEKNVKESPKNKKIVKESPKDKKNVKESPSQPKKAFNSFFTSVKKNDVKKDGSDTKKESKTDAEKMDCSEEKCEESDEDNSIEEKQSPKDKKNVKESPKDEKNVKESPSQPKKAFNSFFTSVKKNDEKKDGSDIKKEAKTSGNDYDPAKLKYHPIDDAIWSRDEKVPYLALSRTLEKIEATSARLKIVETLSNFLRSVLVLTPCDFLPSVYLCLNRLAPAYESVELGIAETTLLKTIAQCTGRTMAQVKADCNTMGDLGLVAEQSKSNQRVMFQPAPLTIRGVFDKLKDIAQMSGHSSMAKKVDKIQGMLVACRHSESRYLMRSLAGKLRVGLAEQSVLQAIAQACTSTPPLGTQGEEWPPKVLNAAKGLTAEQFKALVDAQALVLKTTYCSCPNYDKVVPIILQYGIPALPEHCRLTPGVPLKPMLAHPTKGVHEVLQRFENVEFTCEWKYDGERAQIHVPSAEVDGKTVADVANSSIYSRNQENNTSKYPDVLGRLVGTMKDTVHSCVLDCEAVAWDKEKKQILPFQVLSTRKKKDANEADIKVAVCLFMFDLLYFNGESLVKKPFEERRRLLRENFVEVEGEWHMATSLDCSTTESIQEFLEESVRGNCEGLMVKTLNGKDATYEIAKRSRNWLKLKKDYLEGVGDTIDAVVLGGYLGRGKRAGLYGGFLLGCHDRESDEYQSLCKIGTGFSDQDLSDHIKSLAEHLIAAPKGYYRYDPSLEPDHWFDPVQVWEVKCADLSLSPIHRAGVGIVDPEKGISLRFPRFIRVRTDKTAEEATSAQQIAELYCNQDQVKNQTTNANKNFEDDFY